MSSYRKLLHLLEKELSCQEKLLTLLTRERAAIVKLQKDEIEMLSQEKERIILQAMEVEKQRASVIEGIYTSEEEEPIKLSQLVESCDDPTLKKELLKMGEDLKNTVDSVKDMNDHNGELLKQSLGIIASTIAIMRSAPDTGLPTYNRQGGLKSDDEDRAFAKRSQCALRRA